MDVKIKRQGDAKYLVVTDKRINEQSHYASKDEPIILGALVQFFSSGEYGLQDYRRKEILIPSPFLEEGPEMYMVKSEDEKNALIANLHTYKLFHKENKEVLSWPRFDTYCYDGDIETPKYSSVARFSYKEGYKRLCEQRDFWLNYEGELDSEAIRVANPWRQITASDFLFNLRYGDGNTPGSEGVKRKM